MAEVIGSREGVREVRKKEFRNTFEGDNLVVIIAFRGEGMILFPCQIENLMIDTGKDIHFFHSMFP